MPFALSPARVHDGAYRLCGHHPGWIRRAYLGGFYSTEHYRTCSYCACIHPADMFDLLELGTSKLERTAKPRKYLLLTPNPIAGELVRMGSMPITVFNWQNPPRNLVVRLQHEASERDATTAERLVGHIDRPCLEPAPAFIPQPFYSEHSTDSQWAQIEAMAEGA